MVTQLLSEHLAELAGGHRTPYEIARDFGVIGSFASGKGDVAENRKRYLAQHLHAKRPR